MAKLKESELLHIVNSMESQADTNRSNNNIRNAELFRRYKAELYGTEVAGRSSVVSQDVKDIVESDMPSLVRTFLGSGTIMKFKPTNPSNEKQVKEAEEKSAYVDWLIRSQTNSFRTHYGFLKDIEMFNMGVLKYAYVETVKTEEESFKGVDQLELQEVVDSIESKPFFSNFDITKQEENDDGTFDLTFKVKTKRQEISIMGVPTESFLISPGATDLDDALLVGDTVTKTRGELLAEGFKKKVVADLPSKSIEGSTMRNIRFDDEGNVDQSDFGEWANQTVEISDLYVMVDYDNDGIAERRHIQKSGNHILVNEAFDHVPYAMASALLTPHKAIGEGRAEQVEKIAEVKTALTRQMLDNGYMANNPKIGINSEVNIDDALSNKIGGVYRTKGNASPAQHIASFAVPFVGDKSLLLIQHMDQNKASTVGTQMASQGLNADQLGKETATRFMGVEKAAMAKIELVSRIIAEVGYRKLYEGVAWMVSRFQDSEREFNVLGKTLTSNPSNWRYGHQLDSEVGLGAGDNDQMVENMSGILQVQQQLKANGSPLVDSVKIYNTLNKLTKGLEVKDVSQFFNDPNEPDQLLKAENEALNQMVLTLQEQLQATQNPLAEAEQVKAEAKLIEAQGKAQLDVIELKQKQEQFNREQAQENRQFQEQMALQLTELSLKFNKDIEGSKV